MLGILCIRASLPLAIGFSISAAEKRQKEQLTSHCLQKELGQLSLQQASFVFTEFPLVVSRALMT